MGTTPSEWVTADAGANIAFIKYWGSRDGAERIPMNSSISMTLSRCRTTTMVSVEEELDRDEIVLDGNPADTATLCRCRSFLDYVRSLAERNEKLRVETRNSFPTGAGVASSASGFAALAAAAASAYGIAQNGRELSRLARRGSGSACRSVFGGFVEWMAGTGDEDSYSEQLAPAEHWPDLRDLIAVVSSSPKDVASEKGHALAATSPLYGARLATIDALLIRVRDAIASRDLHALGPIVEREALSLHAIAMTSDPPLLYWRPKTIDVMRTVQAVRRDGLPAYFTLDAGHNVHIITLAQFAEDVGSLVSARGVELIVDQPGCGVGITQEHGCRPDFTPPDTNWTSR